MTGGVGAPGDVGSGGGLTVLVPSVLSDVAIIPRGGTEAGIEPTCLTSAVADDSAASPDGQSEPSPEPHMT